MFTVDEIIIITLVVTGAVIILVIAIVIVIAVTYKIFKTQRERVRELQRPHNREVVREETVLEDNHSEATTHKGEAPPRYNEVITSSDYRSISIENLSQVNIEDKDDRQNNTVEESTELQPPPYSSSQ